MAKIPTMDEMSKQLAQKALDNFLYDGKTLREWMRIIASEDAISRAEVIKLIDKHTNDDGTLDDDITCILEKLPPIQPKAKVGKWISIYGNVKCSICGNVKDGRSVGKATHYCDFCGAEMEVE